MTSMEDNHEDGEEFEEEEVLIVAEISGIIDKGMLNLENQICKILGLETEEPMLQIGDLFFSGDHDESVGTLVLLKEVSEESEDSKKLEYYDQTTKKIKFKRVFLKERECTDVTQNLTSGVEQT